MKIFRTCWLICFIIILVSCEKEVVRSSCGLQNAVKSATQAKGTVVYLTGLGVYAIAVSIEGTFDSQDMGVVCNLPDEFKVVGLTLFFDGTFYPMDLDQQTIIAGQSYYVLELSSIARLN